MRTNDYASASPRENAILLAIGLVIAATSAIQWGGWNAFGGYEKAVAGTAWLVGILYVIRLVAVLERR